MDENENDRNTVFIGRSLASTLRHWRRGGCICLLNAAFVGHLISCSSVISQVLCVDLGILGG